MSNISSYNTKSTAFYPSAPLVDLNVHSQNATASSTHLQLLLNPSTKRHQSSEYGQNNEQDDYSDSGAGRGKGADEKKPARKRNRQALSCTACKSRKIKCSRTFPCIACCKRGDEKDCHWEATTVVVEPQPFALAIDHESLKTRVAHLERMLLLSTGSKSSPGGGGAGSSAATPALTNDGATPIEYKLETLETLDSDTEDAALVLEELALGRKMARVGPGARKAAFTSQTPTFLPYSPHSSSTTISTQLPDSHYLSSLLVTPITGRRKLILDDVWKSIGIGQNKSFWEWLVNQYFERSEWRWHVLHRPTFLSEFQAFGELLEQGRKDEVDPLWLGIFCMIIALSLNDVENAMETAAFTTSEKELEMLPWLYYEAAQACLDGGDWTGKPRIRSLQAIALFAPFLLYSGVGAGGERFQTYLGAATRIVQQLGLNKLGLNPLTMPLDDPALPPGVSTLRREIAIRLLHTLLFFDYVALRVRGSLRPEYIDTSLPGNFDDADLVAERGIVEPKDAGIVTDVSLEVVKFKVALQVRRFGELLYSRSGVEYRAILDLDAGFRSILDELPPELKYDFVPLADEQIVYTWRRNMLCQLIYSRLLKLHRPFMSSGYKDPRYKYSTDSAIEAARRCVKANQSLCGHGPLQLLNIQGSVVVLFMRLWSEFCDEPSLDTISDEQLIKEAAKRFERIKNWRSSITKQIAEQTLQTIALLYEALEKRKRTVELMKLNTGGSWVEDEVESYGHLLKRIGEVVVASATAKASHKARDEHQQTPSGSYLDNGSTATPTSDIKSGAAVTSTLAQPLDPFSMSSDWTGAGGLFRTGSFMDSSFAQQSLDSSRPNEPSFAPTDFTTDFDFNTLLGTEYGLPNFDWIT